MVAGRYALIRQLGQGGMGTVWVAEDATLKRPVAVKMVSASLAGKAQTVERFEREAQSLARLRSPHVVEVHDFGVFCGAPFMVMELLEGEDLAARLERCGRLPPAVALHIMTQMAKALAAAHGAGIVHRDLKPANVFLVPDEGADFVKIFDFGIAKAFEDASGARPLTQEGSVLGTPAYMSPEQLRDPSGVDHRGDLWSLGVIAFRALTGVRPFRGADIASIALSIVSDRHPRPSAIAADLSIALDAFFERALAKDPAARFQSARSFAAELSAAVNIASSPQSACEEWSNPKAPSSPGLLATGPVAGPVPLAGSDSAQRTSATIGALETSLSLGTTRPRGHRMGIWALGVALVVSAGALTVLLTAPSHHDAASQPSVTDPTAAATVAGPSSTATASASAPMLSTSAAVPVESAAAASSSAQVARPPPTTRGRPTGGRAPSGSPKGKDLFADPW
jgi:serine/threonine-protein kinase